MATSTTSACKKVLGTYKLLENLIAHMDPLTINKVARRVSKGWRSIVERSKAIQRVMVPRPSNFKMCPWSHSRSYIHSESVDYRMSPEHDITNFQFNIHPALARTPNLERMAVEGRHVDEAQYILNFPKLEQHDLSQFATFPPCAAVGLLTPHPQPSNGQSRAYPNKDHYCIVYAARGVQLQDLCDVRRILQRQQGPLCFRAMRAEISFGFRGAQARQNSITASGPKETAIENYPLQVPFVEWFPDEAYYRSRRQQGLRWETADRQSLDNSPESTTSPPHRLLRAG